MGKAVIGSGKGRAEIDTGSGSVSFKMDKEYKSSNIEQKSSSKNKADENRYTGKDNPNLAAKVRTALNSNKDIRNANLNVTAVGDRAIIVGTINSVWDIAKAVKIANGVDGVKHVTVDLELDD